MARCRTARTCLNPLAMQEYQSYICLRLPFKPNAAFRGALETRGKVQARSADLPSCGTWGFDTRRDVELATVTYQVQKGVG